MKRLLTLVIVLSFFVSAFTAPALAHFGMIIPSDQMVMQDDSKTVNLKLMFWHPFEGHGMDLVKPRVFGVATGGKTTDLLGTLQAEKLNGHATWKTSYRITRPGVYTFYMEPMPYWEPAEDCFIIHYTKAYVAALGDDEGWDEPIGLKTEIVPLSKPYGLYAGNVFQGVVLLNGKAVPNAEVEVEYYNQDGKRQAPVRLYGHPDDQGRSKRRVHLCRALGRLVGIRGPEHGRSADEARGTGQGHRAWRGGLGQVSLSFFRFGRGKSMHISEGVLSAPVLAAGGVLTVIGTGIGLRKLDYDRLPQVAVLSATFFVASLVHLPIGPSSVHLILNGLMGLLLGWVAFPAILVGLLLQAVLFQYGGLTVLGVNTFNMAMPAVICHYLLGGPARTENLTVSVAAAFTVGAGAIFLSSLGMAAALIFTGESFWPMARLVIVAHLPVMLVEGIFTVICIQFLRKVRPEVLGAIYAE